MFLRRRRIGRPHPQQHREVVGRGNQFLRAQNAPAAGAVRPQPCAVCTRCTRLKAVRRPDLAPAHGRLKDLLVRRIAEGPVRDQAVDRRVAVIQGSDLRCRQCVRVNAQVVDPALEEVRCLGSIRSHAPVLRLRQHEGLRVGADCLHLAVGPQFHAIPATNEAHVVPAEVLNHIRSRKCRIRMEEKEFARRGGRVEVKAKAAPVGL